MVGLYATAFHNCCQCHYAGTDLDTNKFFFFNDTATTEIYTLSLHDALPILPPGARPAAPVRPASNRSLRARAAPASDRKSTRLNSSHDQISYAVFCLKKKIK